VRVCVHGWKQACVSGWKQVSMRVRVHLQVAQGAYRSAERDAAIENLLKLCSSQEFKKKACVILLYVLLLCAIACT